MLAIFTKASGFTTPHRMQKRRRFISWEVGCVDGGRRLVDLLTQVMGLQSVALPLVTSAFI
jgi:hypothetical protein